MLSNLSFMQMAIVISLSIIPSFIMFFLILYSDRKNREPVPLIIISVISCLFTIILSLLIDKVFLKLNISNDILLSYNNYNLFKIISQGRKTVLAFAKTVLIISIPLHK